LLESELFGHERGAFTGAIAQRVGRFELASQGTVFLDEIGEIPLELQPKLLRVLQEREFERLGSSRTLRTDARLIAATNRDLSALVQEHRFRQDLFYRLNVFPIHVPPLRERVEDIPMLVRHFAQQFSRRMKKTIDTIPFETMEALARYDWPGNIRELQNLIERALIVTSEGSLIDVHHLFTSGEKLDKSVLSVRLDGHLGVLGETGNPPAASARAGVGLGTEGDTRQSLPQIEEALMRRALEQCKGNISAAARLLGVTRPQLAYRARKLGI